MTGPGRQEEAGLKGREAAGGHTRAVRRLRLGIRRSGQQIAFDVVDSVKFELHWTSPCDCQLIQRRVNPLRNSLPMLPFHGLPGKQERMAEL